MNNEATMNKSMTLTAAIADFFGYAKSSTGAMVDAAGNSLLKDYKKLTPEDKREITEGLVKAGYTIVERTV